MKDYILRIEGEKIRTEYKIDFPKKQLIYDPSLPLSMADQTGWIG